MITELEREASSIQQQTAACCKVLVVTSAADVDTQLFQFVDALIAAGHRVTAMVGETSTVSHAFSQRRVYYYIQPECSKETNRCFSSVVSELEERLAKSNFDAVVAAGVNSKALAALRLAATKQNVGFRASLPLAASSADSDVSAAKVEVLTRRFDTVCGANDFSSIIEKLAAHSPGGRCASPIVSLSGALMTLAVAARFAKLNQKIYLIIKRLVEVVLSAILLVALFPVIGVLALMRALKGQRPVQRALVQGKGEKPFQLLYFGGEDIGNGPVLSRIWWLPALANVFAGELSFFGPRLLNPAQAEATGLKYWIKPGITGWSQVKGVGADSSALSGMDNLYMASASPILDLKIALLTLKNCIRR